MARETGISWTGTRKSDGTIAPGGTFNVMIGCSKVNEECANCYAEDYDNRYFNGEHWGPGRPRKMMSEHYWNDPIRWNRAAEKEGIKIKVFCSSLADVFDKEIPASVRNRLWLLIKNTPNLIWLLLTKRPENILGMLPSDWGTGYDNVWLGTTTGMQKSFDRNVPIISKIPARKRFLSIEPQLEEVDCTPIMRKDSPIDWVIFGGESGSKARPFDPEWMKKPIEQGKEAGVAVFVKQFGAIWAKDNNCKSKAASDPAEWPEWAKVQEWPDEEAF